MKSWNRLVLFIIIVFVILDGIDGMEAQTYGVDLDIKKAEGLKMFNETLNGFLAVAQQFVAVLKTVSETAQRFVEMLQLERNKTQILTDDATQVTAMMGSLVPYFQAVMI